MDNRKLMLQVLGIAFIAFVAGVAISNPLVSAAPKTTAETPPPFQVLANNFMTTGDGTIWIGGVAGYNEVTLVLSAIPRGEWEPRWGVVTITVCFQKGTTILTPDDIEVCPSFQWTDETPILATQYPVNGADEMVIMTTPINSGYAVSIAILASDSAWYSTNYAAVGGIVLPVNILADLSPWLAVIGLVGCISVLVVVAKARR